MAKFKVGDIWRAQVHFNSRIKKGNHVLIQSVKFVPHKKYMGYDMNVLVLETGMGYVAYTDSRNYTRHFEKVETDVESLQEEVAAAVPARTAEYGGDSFQPSSDEATGGAAGAPL